ncbi:MAG: PAS domain S-box protein [Phycisphaerae bacterium]
MDHPDPTAKPQSSTPIESPSMQMPSIRLAGHEIVWDLARGVVTFDSHPVILAWRDSTAAGLIGGLYEAVGPQRLALAMQSRGRESVNVDWEIISRHPDFEEGFEAIAEIAATAGWGRWKLVELDSNTTQAVFRCFDGWEGQMQRNLGLCWGSAMLAGKLAGYCCRLWDVNCWAVQTRYLARGDDCDEFIVRPSDRTIESEIQDLLKTDQATRADMAVALRKLQNEIQQRKEIEQALRHSEAKYRGYVDNAPDGIFILGPDETYVDVNQAACDMLGYSRAELLQLGPSDLIPTDQEPISQQLIDQMHSQGRGEGEFTFLRKDGSSFPGSVAARKLSDTLTIGFVRDLSRVYLAERRLAEILRLSHDSIFKINIKTGQYEYISTGDTMLSSEVTDELRSKGPEAFLPGLHPEDRPRFEAFWQKVRRGQKADAKTMADFRWRVSPDHPYRYYTSDPVLICDDRGRPESLIGNPRDVTELKLAERRLAQLSRKLLDSHERDSRSLAMELHDSLGQNLISLQFRLQNILLENQGRNDQQAAELAQAADQCRRLVQEVRHICHGLYPPALQTLGLTGAIERLVRSHADAGLEIDCSISDRARHVRFAEDLEIAVFRVAQEALANAHRHAGANTVGIELDYRQPRLSVSIIDDGVGFDPDTANTGIGLNSMRQRAEAVGGILTFQSANPGTRVTLCVQADPVRMALDELTGQ